MISLTFRKNLPWFTKRMAEIVSAEIYDFLNKETANADNN